MNVMKVVVTVNENYLYPLKVMLYSLFSSQEEPVTVILMHSDISEACVGELKEFCESFGEKLTEMRVENGLFEAAPVMGYFSKEMYYRLLCPWLLPGEDRVLYLDPDMIVDDSLSSFYHMDLGGAALAAGRDRPINIDHRKRLRLGRDTIYVNSGMLLMDLKKMRERSKDELLRLIEERKSELIFPDQDIINLFWEGSIQVMEDAYNLNPNILFLKEYLCTPFRKKMKKYAKIIHYMGPKKPWKKGYMNGMYACWARMEWHVNPSKRPRLFGRLLLEPCRFAYGLYLFWKNHDFGKSRTGQA